jgi:hypothetical protein
LSIIAAQVASERETANAHAESLDTKAGVVLGFTGVLVALGATAQSPISANVIFQIGLGVAVAAAVFAAWAFFPRRYPVLELRRLRDNYLTSPDSETQLVLLDTQIEMVQEAIDLVKNKGLRIRLATGCLAAAAALIVVGTLASGGHADAGKPAKARSCHERVCGPSGPSSSASSSPGTSAL